jgi:hypothetical protein
MESDKLVSLVGRFEVRQESAAGGTRRDNVATIRGARTEKSATRPRPQVERAAASRSQAAVAYKPTEKAEADDWTEF